MRDHVKGDLLGKLGGWFVVYRVVNRFGLIPKLINPFLACARNGLIGADHHPFDLRAIMQGFERHNHLRG